MPQKPYLSTKHVSDTTDVLKSAMNKADFVKTASQIIFYLKLFCPTSIPAHDNRVLTQQHKQQQYNAITCNTVVDHERGMDMS